MGKKNCLYCGKEFITNKSNKKYCSDLCGAKYRYRKYRQTPHGRIVANRIALRSYHKNREKRLESMREYHKTQAYRDAKKKFVDKTINFKGKSVNVGFNPRTGICSLLDIVHPVSYTTHTKYTTVMHHYKYDEDNPLAYTFELCINCHLNTVHASGYDNLTLEELIEVLKNG